MCKGIPSLKCEGIHSFSKLICKFFKLKHEDFCSLQPLRAENGGCAPTPEGLSGAGTLMSCYWHPPSLKICWPPLVQLPGWLQKGTGHLQPLSSLPFRVGCLLLPCLVTHATQLEPVAPGDSCKSRTRSRSRKKWSPKAGTNSSDRAGSR